MILSKISRVFKHVLHNFLLRKLDSLFQIIKGIKHLIYYGTLTYTPSACENCDVIHRSSADIDEFKSVKNVSGAMSLLVIDARTHEPLDAEIIIDRFHIVQLLNRALNQVRIKEMKKIRYLRPKDYRKLKKQWRLLLKNDWELNFEDYYTHRLYQGYISEKIMVEYLLSLSKPLAKTYRIANKLRYSLKNRDFKRFKQVLMNSKLKVYPQKMRTALTSLEKYLDSIKNAFTYSLSNGPIEGINNKIKLIKRSGYGYRNFKNLRNRVLISFNLVQNSKKPKALYY